MTLAAEAADSFADILDTVGVPILANGKEAKCVAPTIHKGKAMALDGYEEEQTSEAWLLRADFEALAIKDRDLVEIDGSKFRVITYEDESIAPTIKLNLHAPR